MLEKTLNSLIAQPVPENTEIVISDNASTDTTGEVCKKYRDKYAFIKYFRNESNIGLDPNVLESVRKAQGQYCWLCSDDDIVLEGTLNNILDKIERSNPPFIYLNYAGFLETENYEVIYSRTKDSKDELYYDAEKMIRDHLLNHFSATIFKKQLALNYFYVVDECKKMGCERGYSLAINYYIILNNPGPYIFIGKISLAVRNPIDIWGNSYNPLTIIIDMAMGYQSLVKKGLISEYTENYILSMLLKGFYKIVLPMRLFNDPGYTKDKVKKIMELCGKYKTFRIYLYPFMVLPKWLLFLPYIIIRKIKGLYRRVFNKSPF